MQNVLTVVAGYLGKISLPGMAWKTLLKSDLFLFVYQFMA